MSATAVDLMLKIGTQVPCATLRRGATKMVLIVCANYMEYEQANHPFCCKAMHKTMYPSF